MHPNKPIDKPRLLDSEESECLAKLEEDRIN
jgi:hypothetical protein